MMVVVEQPGVDIALAQCGLNGGEIHRQTLILAGSAFRACRSKELFALGCAVGFAFGRRSAVCIRARLQTCRNICTLTRPWPLRALQSYRRSTAGLRSPHRLP